VVDPLLIREVPVDCHEGLEPICRHLEQRSVVEIRPTHLARVANLVTLEFACQAFRHAGI
jgi:hypothetical protein